MSGPGFYNPAAFRVDDPAVLAGCIETLMFATLVSNGADGPGASHLPLLLEGPAGVGGVLRGHLARANGHGDRLHGEAALAIFQGPAHYVSPAWYPSKAASGRVVPTWNYVVVHVRGRVRVREERDWLHALVTDLTDRLEHARPAPWSVSDAPDDYVETMLAGIVGVELAITGIEGKFKLGQNRSEPDRAGLAAGLAAERPEIAAALRQLPGIPRDL